MLEWVECAGEVEDFLMKLWCENLLASSCLEDWKGSERIILKWSLGKEVLKREGGRKSLKIMSIGELWYCQCCVLLPES